MRKPSDLSVSDSGENRLMKVSLVLASVLLAILHIIAPRVSSATDAGLTSNKTVKERSSGGPALGKGSLYALVVGVSTYRDPKIPKLDLADRDAQAFGDFLRDQTKIFTDTHVTFLLNEKATKSEVEKYLYYMLPKAGKDDTVILFFSGHGAFDPMRPKEFLFLSYDSESDYIGTTGVKMSGLEFLKGISAERALIIADACHAGGFSQMKPKALNPSLDLFLREARNSSGRAIISSAKDGQLSWELPDGKNSVFTHNLLEGLKGKADKDHDGVVTLNEAYEYAYNRTKDDTGGRQHPQFEGTVVGAFPLSFVGPRMPESELRKKFVEAVWSGELEKVEKFLVQGVDVDLRDEDNTTPLIISSRKGYPEIVKLLLSKAAEVDATDNSRSTPLLGSSENGHIEVVKLLMAAGANVDLKDMDGGNALAVASRNGHLKVVEMLLDERGDIKSRTNTGDTALTLACAGGHFKVVELLLNWGADVNAENLEGANSLTKAFRGGHPQVVKLLLEKGATIKITIGGNLERELVIASLHGDIREVKRILAQGVSVDAETSSGDTALTLAAGLGNLELVKLLASKGANVNARIAHDETSLLAAAGADRGAILQTLLALGADVQARDRDGNTALILAGRGGRTEIVKILLSNNADVNARNKNQSTALLSAGDNGQSEVVRLLLAKGADVQAKDKDGNTGLILAAQNGHADTVKLLVAKNSDVNARNSEGGTALILAAKNGRKAVIKLLLAAGADVTAEDWEGKTALVLASERGRPEIVELLKAP